LPEIPTHRSIFVISRWVAIPIDGLSQGIENSEIGNAPKELNNQLSWALVSSWSATAACQAKVALVKGS